MYILAVDDDSATLDLLRRGLSYEGYEVETAPDGATALEKSLRRHPDLVLLDWLMPGLSGLEVMRRLHESLNTPVILITAKGMVGDRVVGLDSGADDYLVKPFSIDELLARVRAVMRRRGMLEKDNALVFAGIRLDPDAHEVSYHGAPLDLSGKEFYVLELLLRSPRQVVSRDVFYERIWGVDYGDSNMIDVYISFLRRKLTAAGARGLLQTIRGSGYILREPPS